MDGWRKSSFSGGNTNCVEVAFSIEAVGVRDSKSPEAGHLELPPRAWVALVQSLTDRSGMS